MSAWETKTMLWVGTETVDLGSQAARGVRRPEAEVRGWLGFTGNTGRRALDLCLCAPGGDQTRPLQTVTAREAWRTWVRFQRLIVDPKVSISYFQAVVPFSLGLVII